MLEPARITARVTAVFEKLNVRCLIGGSLASTLYGMVRTTQGSDLVAEMVDEYIEALKPLPAGRASISSIARASSR
jgi:hypothetical protein